MLNEEGLKEMTLELIERIISDVHAGKLPNRADDRDFLKLHLLGCPICHEAVLKASRLMAEIAGA